MSTSYTPISDGSHIAISTSGVSFEKVQMVASSATPVRVQIPEGTRAIRVQTETTTTDNIDLDFELTDGGTSVNVLYLTGSAISPDVDWVIPISSLEREFDATAGEYWPQLKLTRVGASGSAVLNVWFHK
jgi:hypothetical protein